MERLFVGLHPSSGALRPTRNEWSTTYIVMSAWGLVSVMRWTLSQRLISDLNRMYSGCSFLWLLIMGIKLNVKYEEILGSTQYQIQISHFGSQDDKDGCYCWHLRIFQRLSSSTGKNQVELSGKKIRIREKVQFPGRRLESGWTFWEEDQNQGEKPVSRIRIRKRDPGKTGADTLSFFLLSPCVNTSY